MNPSYEEDRQLLFRCFAGDRKAAETLVRRFSGLVYRYVQHTLVVRHVSFDQSMLEDFHNTVFLHLFENKCKKLRRYEGRNGCSLSTWIRLITIRTVLNHLRDKGFDAIYPQKKQISIDDLPELQSPEMEASASIERAEREQSLQEAIRSLPPRSRLFIKLHFQQRLPVEEVASALQISVQNAYTMKHRVIQKVKAYILNLTVIPDET